MHRIIATTVADAIRERLIRYTPIVDAHQALILAYTRRQYDALRGFVVEHDVDVNLDDIDNMIEQAINEADRKSLTVPILPLG